MAERNTYYVQRIVKGRVPLRVEITLLNCYCSCQKLIFHSPPPSISLRLVYHSVYSSTSTYNILSLFLQPSAVTLPSGRTFLLSYDPSGGLSSIGLPSSGSATYDIHVQPGFGCLRYFLRPPGFSTPFVTYRTHDGRILETRKPAAGGGGSSSGTRVFKYDALWRLTAAAAGDEITRYSYDDDGRLQRVEHKYEDRSGGGSFGVTMLEVVNDEDLIEQTISFSAQTGLASTKFFYSSKLGDFIGGRIGGQALQAFSLDYQWGANRVNGVSSAGRERQRLLNGGGLRRGEGVGRRSRRPGQFVAEMHSLNGTTLSDSTAVFFRSETSESLLINGKKVYSAEFAYDACHAKIEIANRKIVKETGEFQQIVK